MNPDTVINSEPNLHALAEQIKAWGKEAGFQQIGITDVELGEHEERFQQWLDQGLHGDLEYMASHGTKRSRPGELIPGTVRVISVRLDYLSVPARENDSTTNAEHARVSRYALGRDYHKLIRKRLQAYDLSNKALRDWWIDAAEEVCSDPAIDGIFLDGVVKVLEPVFLKGVITPEKKAAELAGYVTVVEETRKMLGPRKLLLANILRARFSDWVSVVSTTSWRSF